MELKTCNDCGNFIWNDGFTPMPNVCVECRFEDGLDGPSDWMPKEGADNGLQILPRRNLRQR